MKRTGVAMTMALVVSGCFTLPGGPTEDGGPVDDAGRLEVDAGPPTRCQRFDRYDTTYCTEIPSKVVCGGVECAANEECCLTSGRCVERGDAGSCPVLPTTWPDQPPPPACSANTQCGEGFFCMPDDLSCGGPSHCQRIELCGYCEPVGSSYCEVCGCNGITYPSVQHACIAGVNVVGSGACGVSACVTDSQCPADSFCCPSGGTCTLRAESWRCGQGLNCVDDSECVPPAGSGGGPGSTAGVFCRHAGCGIERGTCTRVNANECGGAVNTVCGCDGVSYVNECWAHAASVNVASAGACP